MANCNDCYNKRLHPINYIRNGNDDTEYIFAGCQKVEEVEDPTYANHCEHFDSIVE